MNGVAVSEGVEERKERWREGEMERVLIRLLLTALLRGREGGKREAEDWKHTLAAFHSSLPKRANIPPRLPSIRQSSSDRELSWLISMLQ